MNFPYAPSKIACPFGELCILHAKIKMKNFIITLYFACKMQGFHKRASNLGQREQWEVDHIKIRNIHIKLIGPKDAKNRISNNPKDLISFLHPLKCLFGVGKVERLHSARVSQNKLGKCVWHRTDSQTYKPTMSHYTGQLPWTLTSLYPPLLVMMRKLLSSFLLHFLCNYETMKIQTDEGSA